ncbi:MAG: NAD(P)-dependent alcohol dehydrogenase [Cyclobacteriaceae bacterium]|nr:NAD(P)-dependent alcohol dehydrogenase [Cyclobacteriaceae bacterium]
MNAICYSHYGGPEQLMLANIPTPAPKPGHVLVRVKAASINSWDYDMLHGRAFIMRVLSGFTRPKYHVLGCDVAGVVEATGPNCHHWQPGDEVFGDIASAGFGAFAEFVSVPEGLLARKSASLSFHQAAAVPQAGLLAIQGLRHRGEVTAGQRVLINGAGGGVGPIALTYAKSRGAHVTAVDRPEKLDFLRALGADELIDFTATDYTNTGQRYDKILDVIAHRSASEYRQALTPNGVFTMIGGSMGGLLLRMMMVEPLLSKFRNQKLGIMGYHVSREGLAELAHLLETGVIQVPIDSTFPLAHTRAAFEHFMSGKFKGKIVIDMGANGMSPNR